LRQVTRLKLVASLGCEEKCAFTVLISVSSNGIPMQVHRETHRSRHIVLFWLQSAELDGQQSYPLMAEWRRTK
jgi:hypothetical protein